MGRRSIALWLLIQQPANALLDLRLGKLSLQEFTHQVFHPTIKMHILLGPNTKQLTVPHRGVFWDEFGSFCIQSRTQKSVGTVMYRTELINWGLTKEVACLRLSQPKMLWSEPADSPVREKT